MKNYKVTTWFCSNEDPREWFENYLDERLDERNGEEIFTVYTVESAWPASTRSAGNDSTPDEESAAE